MDSAAEGDTNLAESAGERDGETISAEAAVDKDGEIFPEEKQTHVEEAAAKTDVETAWAEKEKKQVPEEAQENEVESSGPSLMEFGGPVLGRIVEGPKENPSSAEKKGEE